MNIGFKYLILIGFISIKFSLLSQIKWEAITTIEDLNRFDSKILTKTIDQLNLDYPGLENVKAAYMADDPIQAAKDLLDYYKNNTTASNYRKEVPKASTRTNADADTTLNNIFIIQNVSGRVPYLEDGHRDWYYKGPNNDREWAWLSNRHSQINQMLSVYFDTGNPKYIEYMDLFLKDFILASLPYPAEKGSESIWRGLEVSFRAKVWTRLFYSLINNPDLSEATKFLILFSLPDHAHYNRNFHGQNNWLTMEISALATVAAYFPEYKNSAEWMDYSVGTMIESMKDQIYPDGVQTELTSHYHNVSLHNFEQFEELCEVADKELPAYYPKTMEAMYNYIAHAVRPDGNRILNNDGDRGSDVSLISRGAEKYNHLDWTYIISNGKSGISPTDGPSYFFSWAGQMISRSGFDRDAHWSFFDLGPWGSGHQHNDKLHLSVAAYGRDLLVDAGRFAYTGAVAQKFRGYARGSAGHNVILIDGKGQAPGPTHAKEALTDEYFKITSDYDYASNSFNDFYDSEGEVSHKRSMVYVRGSFWVVIDRVETDRKRGITSMWHWHPDCKVTTDKRITKTVNERGNLAVIPVGKTKFTINQVVGQENPDLQGWYSPEYNIYGPNTASLYQTKIKKSSNLVWLLVPSENDIPEVIAEINSQNDKQVNLTVSLNGQTWGLVIPFENSSEVSVVNR
ncbi:MAG: alginate lyase family protein [Bacteroidota bacterium]